MTNDEKRSLTVLGTLVIFAALVTLIAVPYVRKWRFYDKAISERSVRIKNLKRQIVNKPALMTAIDTFKTELDGENLFILADKQGAESELLGQMKKIIEAVGGEINSLNVQSVSRRGSKIENRVGVRVNCFLNNEGLVDLLHQLAINRPLFTVAKMQLVPVTKRVHGTTEDTGRVRLDMTIEAFYKTAEEATDTTAVTNNSGGNNMVSSTDSGGNNMVSATDSGGNNIIMDKQTEAA